MDYILLKDFLTAYSLPTVIIAVIVGIICLFADKFLSVKFPALIKAYLPFVLSVALHVAFDMLFTYRAFKFYPQSLYAGLLSGSLSAIFISATKKIASGKPLPLSATVLLIEGLIAGYVESSTLNQTATALDNIIQNSDCENELLSQITCVIKDNGKKEFSEEDLKGLAMLIIKAVKTINAE